MYFEQIFSCILSLRSNDLGQVGCLEKDRPLKFTPFFVCFSPDSFSSGGGVSTSLLSPTLLDLHSTFTAVLACLEKVGGHHEDSSSICYPLAQLYYVNQGKTLERHPTHTVQSYSQALWVYM